MCKEEFLLDSSDLRSQIRTLNDAGEVKDKNIHLFTLDVEKLYPSIDPQLALQAIEQTLREGFIQTGKFPDKLRSRINVLEKVHR